MKHHLSLSLSILLLSACTSATTNKGIPTKTYTNEAAHVSFNYPATWQAKERTFVPNEYQTDELYGAEGKIDVTWGNGLGGACGENGQEKLLEKMTFNGEQFDVCHKQESGGESWTMISKSLTPDMGVTVDAYAASPSITNRNVILSILSTLTFTK